MPGDLRARRSPLTSLRDRWKFQLERMPRGDARAQLRSCLADLNLVIGEAAVDVLQAVQIEPSGPVCDACGKPCPGIEPDPASGIILCGCRRASSSPAPEPLKIECPRCLHDFTYPTPPDDCDVCGGERVVRPLQYPMGVREELPEEPCPKCAAAPAPRPRARERIRAEDESIDAPDGAALEFDGGRGWYVRSGSWWVPCSEEEGRRYQAEALGAPAPRPEETREDERG